MKNEQIKWALVTGASYGVGKEIALILAKKGFNVAITARNAQKLEALQKEILMLGVKSDFFICDLSKKDAAKKLYDSCIQKNIFIDLLVNNAGAGLYGESVDTVEKVEPLIQLNVIALTELCSLFGKDMKMRKNGSILNIGSVAGNNPTAYFASYAASKAYVLSYSLALRHELAPYGVNVTCVQPGYIRTGFDDSCGIKSEKYKKFSFSNGMSACAVAKSAVNAVLKKRSFTQAGFSNKLTALFTSLLPKNCAAYILAKSIWFLTKE